MLDKFISALRVPSFRRMPESRVVIALDTGIRRCDEFSFLFKSISLRPLRLRAFALGFISFGACHG
jgi:hypothetical protein